MSIRLSVGALGLAFIAASSGVHADTVSRTRVLAALPKLEVLAAKAIADGQVPGMAVAIVHQDELVYLKGFGVREAGRPEAVDGSTVFQLASLSKPVSATVVAALVSQGLVTWHSRIADLDPVFALKDAYPTQQLTVRDLFNHRSGLPGTAGDDLEDIGYSQAEVLRRLRLVTPSSSFRAGYSYSNFGLTEGAVAAAKPTNKPWETVAEEYLYRPLGMASTSSRYGDFVARDNRASLHIGGIGQWVARLERNPDAQSPAGGVSSSARDLAQWLRLELAGGKLDGKQLINPAALAATHDPLMARGTNPVTGAASFYGLGWNVEFGRHGLSWGHAGAFSVGARTLATLYPDASLGIVILTNAFPTGVPEGLADSFADLVFSGTVARDWIGDWNGIFAGLFGPALDAARRTFGTSPTPNTPALPEAAYIGVYENDFIGQAKVTSDGAQLKLTVGPGGKTIYPMTHFNRDMFLIYPDPEIPDAPSPVTFAIGTGGKAISVTVENLNTSGLGTLKKMGD